MNIIVAVLILGIIVIVHELGHFLLAKKNGITVTEFSVGMGPRIASFVRNGTRYSLKLLPFGGSCMMLGEDETIEDDGAFHKKGVWARFSVLFAGAFFNFILAFVLALIVLGNVGIDSPTVNYVKKGSAADGILQEGDLITRIDGTGVTFSRELNIFFNFNKITDKPIEITLIRDGDKKTVDITPVYKDIYQIGCSYTRTDEPAKLASIVEGFPLDKAGIKLGDTIVAINGNRINSWNDFATYFEENPIDNTPLDLTYLRDNEEHNITITPVLAYSGYEMGWDYNQYRTKVSAIEVVKYSFFEVAYNIEYALKSLGYLVSGRVNVNEVTGPVGIVNYVGEVVNETKEYGVANMLLSLANFALLISANLGVMNLLPLPALDGGRLVFVLIEAIRKKPVPKEKEAIVHLVGMAVLMLFMVFVMYNDIRRMFVK
ncbi:RIP metalloprotease RseP [Lachnospiraceae bacterium MD1]|jgi:regulator of sigma E protease|uniref:Zinc metalloprotease n=1 Tax=Variimorphobacter saccharofermentans TaxID=2755051 RepID=A0A839JYT0_9FIRM|nr:RIP metalloprotease RseP [Variimorphobacter saccharofermentans]MBB2182825.1 RIP metalloprotease RseP [Variimorphobacter saccharofermentans]